MSQPESKTPHDWMAKLVLGCYLRALSYSYKDGGAISGHKGWKMDSVRRLTVAHIRKTVTGYGDKEAIWIKIALTQVSRQALISLMRNKIISGGCSVLDRIHGQSMLFAALGKYTQSQPRAKNHGQIHSIPADCVETDNGTGNEKCIYCICVWGCVCGYVNAHIPSVLRPENSKHTALCSVTHTLKHIFWQASVGTQCSRKRSRDACASLFHARTHARTALVKTVKDVLKHKKKG